MPVKELKSVCRVAVVQASPVLFDKAACLDKALGLLLEAAGNGAELVVFPELFIPCYPFGLSFGFTVGHREESGREDWKRYYDNSLLIPGPETEALAKAAKEAGVWLSIGVSERVADSATLYNSNLIFSPAGELAAHHRKLKPTGAERVVWGDAQSHYFPVADTPWGPMGSLICWESYMPLARVALYQKGVTLYLSPNTNDNPEWAHRHRGPLLLHQLRHVLYPGPVSQRPARPGGDRPPAGNRLPGRQQRDRPLRAPGDGDPVGPGGYPVCGPGSAAGARQPHGV